MAKSEPEESQDLSTPKPEAPFSHSSVSDMEQPAVPYDRPYIPLHGDPVNSISS